MDFLLLVPGHVYSMGPIISADGLRHHFSSWPAQEQTIEQFQVGPYLAAQSTKLLTCPSLYQLFCVD